MKAVNTAPRVEERVAGGWLLVLCRLLILWQPIVVGILMSRALDSLAIRGRLVQLILLTRVLVTALGVAAGLALRHQHRAAVGLAKASLALSAATDTFIYLTPYFPSSRAPGETPLWVVGTLTFYVGWFIYLMRSTRVRETFGPREI